MRVCNILLVDFTVPEVDPIRLPLGRLEFREMVRTNVDEITVRRTWTTVLDKVSDKLVDIPELDNVRTKNCKTFLISVSMIRERWLYPFYKGDSVKAVFHKQRNEKIEINMMRQTGFFNYLYLTNMRSQVVEMPLSDETFSVFIILPDKKMKFQRLDKWTKRMDMRDVLRQVNKPVMLEISVPTGYVQSVTTEKDVQGEGINAENFALGSWQRHDYNYLRHFILVLEEGGGGRLQAEEAEKELRGKARRFMADHPFLIFVYHKKLDSIFWSGTVFG